MKKVNKVAAEFVAAYYERYVGARGCLPRMAVGMMHEYGQGFPVRNPDGGSNIAYFSSQEAAQEAVNKCDRKFGKAVA